MEDRLMEKPNRPLAKFREMVNAGRITLIMTVAFALCFTLSYASAGGGEAEGGKNWSDFGWRAFDFAVLAGLLYWLLAGKVKEFFSERRKSVKTSLEKVEAAKEEAKRKFAEYDAKLDKAAEEIREMAETIRSQGLREKERIIADALRTAEKMKEDARKRMEQEMKKARAYRLETLLVINADASAKVEITTNFQTVSSMPAYCLFYIVPDHAGMVSCGNLFT